MKPENNIENTAGSDCKERLVSSLWARHFKEKCPTGYAEAIRRAGELVKIYETDETGEGQWAITLEDGFWMDAYPTKEEAAQLVDEMGWPIIGANDTEQASEGLPVSPCSAFIL